MYYMGEILENYEQGGTFLLRKQLERSFPIPCSVSLKMGRQIFRPQNC